MKEQHNKYRLKSFHSKKKLQNKISKIRMTASILKQDPNTLKVKKKKKKAIYYDKTQHAFLG